MRPIRPKPLIPTLIGEDMFTRKSELEDRTRMVSSYENCLKANSKRFSSISHVVVAADKSLLD